MMVYIECASACLDLLHPALGQLESSANSNLLWEYVMQSSDKLYSARFLKMFFTETSRDGAVCRCSVSKAYVVAMKNPARRKYKEQSGVFLDSTNIQADGG